MSLKFIQDLHQKLLSMGFPHTVFYLSKDNYLEVTAKHVSKEHALLEVAKYYDIPLEQIMTIGDNFNDSPMPVSYTHLDVYKRQISNLCQVINSFPFTLGLKNILHLTLLLY